MYKIEKDESFGKYIERVRLSKGYSQRKVAQITGISNTTINRIESGSTPNPEPNTLKILAKALDIEESYLLEVCGIIEKGSNSKLNKKDEKDVEKLLNQTMEYIEDQEGLMLNGEILDENDIELLKQAIKNGLEYAKISNKRKYTPNKYRK